MSEEERRQAWPWLLLLGGLAIGCAGALWVVVVPRPEPTFCDQVRDMLGQRVERPELYRCNPPTGAFADVVGAYGRTPTVGEDFEDLESLKESCLRADEHADLVSKLDAGPGESFSAVARIGIDAASGSAVDVQDFGVPAQVAISSAGDQTVNLEVKFENVRVLNVRSLDNILRTTYRGDAEFCFEKICDSGISLTNKVVVAKPTYTITAKHGLSSNIDGSLQAALAGSFAVAQDNVSTITVRAERDVAIAFRTTPTLEYPGMRSFCESPERGCGRAVTAPCKGTSSTPFCVGGLRVSSDGQQCVPCGGANEPPCIGSDGRSKCSSPYVLDQVRNLCVECGARGGQPCPGTLVADTVQTMTPSLNTEAGRVVADIVAGKNPLCGSPGELPCVGGASPVDRPESVTAIWKEVEGEIRRVSDALRAHCAIDGVAPNDLNLDEHRSRLTAKLTGVSRTEKRSMTCTNHDAFGKPKDCGCKSIRSPEPAEIWERTHGPKEVCIHSGGPGKKTETASATFKLRPSVVEDLSADLVAYALSLSCQGCRDGLTLRNGSCQ